jgi:hypothetical protein
LEIPSSGEHASFEQGKKGQSGHNFLNQLFVEILYLLGFQAARAAADSFLNHLSSIKSSRTFAGV